MEYISKFEEHRLEEKVSTLRNVVNKSIPGSTLAQYKNFAITEKDRSGFEKNIGLIDKEFIPYIKMFNSNPNFCSLESCTGHVGTDQETNAYFTFKSNYNEDFVIAKVLSPLQDKYGKKISFKLEYDDLVMFGYYINLDHYLWKKQISDLIKLCNKI